MVTVERADTVDVAVVELVWLGEAVVVAEANFTMPEGFGVSSLPATRPRGNPKNAKSSGRYPEFARHI